MNVFSAMRIYELAQFITWMLQTDFRVALCDLAAATSSPDSTSSRTSSSLGATDSTDAATFLHSNATAAWKFPAVS
jgi:hypothetical protein